MVDHNRLFDILRAHGYKIITFEDEYELTDITNADLYLSPRRWVMNGFQNELLNTTPLPYLFRAASLKSPFDIHREHLLYILRHLAFTSSSEQPRFILAHILAPHPPFVFGLNGEATRSEVNFTINDADKISDKADQERFIRGYREQASFMTARLLPELEKIIINSRRPVIILIQGDHGPGLYLDWLSVENTDLVERMAIFSAYFFYDKNYQLLSPDISPVNSFRVILNQYFDAHLPILENRSYYTKVYRPYDFIDVTNDLRENWGNKPVFTLP
jgi:hypothetical protein